MASHQQQLEQPLSEPDPSQQAEHMAVDDLAAAVDWMHITGTRPQDALIMWQFKHPSNAADSTWKDMPMGITRVVEHEYQRQVNSGAFTVWRHMLMGGVQLVFDFTLMQQHSETHNITRKIRRILITNA